MSLLRPDFGGRRSDVPPALAQAHGCISRGVAGLSLRQLKRVYSGFIPLPWILATMLLANGALDSKESLTYYPTTVESRYNMPGIVRGTRRLIVRSWRDGQKIERLAVDFDDYDRFRPGDAVSVSVKRGALGIPWYFGVYRR